MEINVLLRKNSLESEIDFMIEGLPVTWKVGRQAPGHLYSDGARVWVAFNPRSRRDAELLVARWFDLPKPG